MIISRKLQYLKYYYVWPSNLLKGKDSVAAPTLSRLGRNSLPHFTSLSHFVLNPSANLADFNFIIHLLDRI